MQVFAAEYLLYSLMIAFTGIKVVVGSNDEKVTKLKKHECAKQVLTIQSDNENQTGKKYAAVT